ncbi:MAG: aspartate kinase [Ruminococcaceae bacterium]|nr:aspartate kinase [Oscillospiraceae bacterium]
MLIVQKFGGSSLADAARIRRAAQRAVHAAEMGNQVIVVVSAQGDTTDRLVSAAAAITKDASAREMDSYLASGEQMSACLMAMAIGNLGRTAISLTGWQAGILTDDCHSDARIQALVNNRILQELACGKIVVVMGFQGVSAAGDITTLGRGGSDTTAVALAAFLNADKCQIYTDVDGIYDRDPRIFPDAVRYDAISYEDMLTLARQGAQVLHVRAVEMAQKYQVTLQVLSSFRPGPGTTVTALP